MMDGFIELQVFSHITAVAIFWVVAVQFISSDLSFYYKKINANLRISVNHYCPFS